MALTVVFDTNIRDMDLLELKNFRGVEIVRASEFLSILAKES